MYARMKSLFTDQAEKALSFAEVQIRPELKGINGLASSFALLVMADRVAEEEELEAVSEYLIDMDIVIEKGLIREVSTVFMEQVSRLEKAFQKNVVEGNIVVGEILRDLSALKDDQEWCDVVAETITIVTSGDAADESEVKARSRILKALGKA